MSNKRWSSDDKIELMRLYASGRSYEEISKTLDRSPNAIKLRLEAIIYENLIKDKPVKLLIRLLNTDIDTIKQFYYSHKSFLQAAGKKVHDITFPNNEENNDKELIGGSFEGKQRSVNSNDNSINQSENYNTMQRNDIKYNNIKNTKHRTLIKNDKANEQNDIIQKKYDHLTSTNKLQYIENENYILKEIIKNHKMKKQVRKLYVDGKLDKKTSDIYEKLLKFMKDN